MSNFNNLRAWCLTDGSAGTISQVRGLAEALKVNFEQKIIDLKFPWNKLPVGILPPSKIIFNNYEQISLETNIPPEIIISCGKRSIYASLYLKKSLKNKVFSIHIQDPKINPDKFDLVITPVHDNLNGENVIKTDLAINHINQNLLSKEAELYANQFSEIQKPICAIFLGGKSRNYRFDVSAIKQLADQIDKILKNNDIRLFILFSRRTDRFIIEYLNDRFLDQNIIWNGEGNPYLALMQYSKYLICTADSVSIISESISSSKPVYIFKLPSLKKNNRIEKFIAMILHKNYARLLGENLEDFTNSYENETIQVARMIEERYNNKS
ncbi:mitochondrial fission ELM1 family protein [Pelagibacteraceae bacterium]|nr:mitochondrial fission ELM1 family protein [Pelagibacteraceae bacterium]